MNIRPVGVKLFYAERQRDKMKLTVTFCNFVNTPKIWNLQEMCLVIWCREVTSVLQSHK